ncbi:hypothetical protein [Terrabacter sp. NPDC080008]|uniref:hypothetical protein n=1 Tax=Terrabacter sp. NPDC080008 TaxID=3155176 RepID=UPI00344BB36D
MVVSQDQADVRPGKPRRLRRLFIATAGSLVLVSALAAYVLGVFHRNVSPYQALDAYTSAVATGDRDALEAAVVDGPRRGTLIDRHAGRPMTPTGVSMEQMPSAVWWSVEIRYELPGEPSNSEHVLIHPRDDSPDRFIDYVVEPAP